MKDEDAGWPTVDSEAELAAELERLSTRREELAQRLVELDGMPAQRVWDEIIDLDEKLVAYALLERMAR